MMTLARSILLGSLLLATASSKEKSMLVLVENPAAFERNNETIEIPLHELVQKVGAVDAGRVVVMNVNNDRALLSQLTESGLLFQSDFKPLEKKEFIVRLSDGKPVAPLSLVDGRFVLPREDYAWENDRIAFRVYGPALAKDVSNGIDVWTKRVRYLIVEKWYSASNAAGKDSYHEDRGEGADFFSVGRSLGAGSSGLWLNDSLHQPGVFSAQRTICNGPIRVTFELTYANWSIDGKKITEHRRVSLDAGQNLNRIEVSFDGLEPQSTVSVACGLVKRANTTISRDETHCRMSLWGPTTADTANGFLGTGVILSPSSCDRFGEDKNQYLIIGRAKTGQSFTYYAGAGWTKSGDFTTGLDWNSYLDNFARKLQTPLLISTTAQ